MAAACDIARQAYHVSWAFTACYAQYMSFLLL
jgi:HPt (histidine-containing phosphotransfer) domain-containing protein